MSKKKKKGKKKRGSRRERKLIKAGIIKPKELPVKEEHIDQEYDEPEVEAELEEEKEEEIVVEETTKKKKKSAKVPASKLYAQFKPIIAAVSLCLLIVGVLYWFEVEKNWMDNISQLIQNISPPWDWKELFS